MSMGVMIGLGIIILIFTILSIRSEDPIFKKMFFMITLFLVLITLTVIDSYAVDEGMTETSGLVQTVYVVMLSITLLMLILYVVGFLFEIMGRL